MDIRLPIVPVVLPRGDVALHGFKIGDSPIQALPVQGAKLDLRHVEPTAMLGRVMNFDAFCQPPSLLRFKHLIEGGKAECVHVIHARRTRVAFG